MDLGTYKISTRQATLTPVDPEFRESRVPTHGEKPTCAFSLTEPSLGLCRSVCPQNQQKMNTTTQTRFCQAIFSLFLENDIITTNLETRRFPSIKITSTQVIDPNLIAHSTPMSFPTHQSGVDSHPPSTPPCKSHFTITLHPKSYTKKNLFSSNPTHTRDTNKHNANFESEISTTSIKPKRKRQWFSGKIHRCHRWAPRSIRG